MKVSAIVFSAVDSKTSKIFDNRVFLYDSEVITEDLAKEIIENPLKGAKYHGSYINFPVVKLPFLAASSGAIQELLSSIFNIDVEKQEEESDEFNSFYSESKYLS